MPDRAAVERALATVLKDTRTELEWSQEQVAAKCRIHPRTIVSYETGQRHLSVARLLELADVYGVTPEKLLTAARRRAGDTSCPGCGRPALDPPTDGEQM